MKILLSDVVMVSYGVSVHVVPTTRAKPNLNIMNMIKIGVRYVAHIIIDPPCPTRQ